MLALDVTGQTFGYLTAVRRIAPGTNDDTKWLCLCQCGKSHEAHLNNLRTGKVRSCGCLAGRNGSTTRGHRWKGYKEISGTFWNKTKQGAKQRGINFEVTIEEAWELFLKQQGKCALSGLNLIFEKKYKKLNEATASLDRIDSNKGYISGNIQWVHKDINLMKLDYTQEEFIKYCSLVAIHCQTPAT